MSNKQWIKLVINI